MSAAAVIAMRRKRLVRRFREAGATDPEHAITLEAVGERPTWVFRQMVGAGAFRATPEGRYFMDDAAATQFLHRCRVRAFVGAGICLLLFLVLWLCGVFRK
jgi:hypothetical protein